MIFSKAETTTRRKQQILDKMGLRSGILTLTGKECIFCLSNEVTHEEDMVKRFGKFQHQALYQAFRAEDRITNAQTLPAPGR